MKRIRAAAATIAIVSGDRSLVKRVISLLADETTSVLAYIAFTALLAAMSATTPDVIVMEDDEDADAMLQIRQIRRRQPSVHILYFKVASEQRTIDLLESGADDAIAKDSEELIPRIQAATRRARTLNAQNRIAIGDIVVDREARRVWVAGDEVPMTPHEFSVLDCLFWHTPKPVGVDTLADFVWGDEDKADRRSLVHVYVSYVRRKLGTSAQVVIKYARGVGYAFLPRTQRSSGRAKRRV